MLEVTKEVIRLKTDAEEVEAGFEDDLSGEQVAESSGEGEERGKSETVGCNDLNRSPLHSIIKAVLSVTAHPDQLRESKAGVH